MTSKSAAKIRASKIEQLEKRMKQVSSVTEVARSMGRKHQNISAIFRQQSNVELDTLIMLADAVGWEIEFKEKKK